MARPRSKKHQQLFEAAVHACVTTELRSEDSPSFLEHFVDFGHVDLLRSHNWQLVLGRRGTGKTHLFGALREQSALDVCEDRNLWLYFTAQDFLLSPAGAEINDRQRALGYFQTFINQLGRELTSNVDRILASPRVFERLLGQRRRTLDRIQTLTLDILYLVEVGHPVAAHETPDIRQTTTFTEEAGTKTNIGIRMNTSSIPGGEAHASKVAGRSHLNQVVATGSSRPVPRLQEVREKIQDLLAELNIEHLFILIDEWSTLDPSASSSIQPEFAELLKRTFAGSPRITVKVATNRFQTRLSNRASGTEYRGLEVGADIFEGVNLDRALMGEEQLVKFYRKLLFKRLCAAEPQLSMYLRAEDEPNEEYVLELFADHRAFVELVRGAEGIPRRFLMTFVDLARRTHYSLEEKWDVRRVHQSIVACSQSQDDDIDYHSEANQVLWGQIREIVTRNHARVVFARRRDLDSLRRALDELLEKRFIHELDASELPSEIRGTYAGYSVDYGLWLDWERARSFDDDRPSDLAGLSSMPKGDALKACLDPQLVRHQTVRCVNCESRFDPGENSYVVRQLCPKCFLPADESVTKN